MKNKSTKGFKKTSALCNHQPFKVNAYLGNNKVLREESNKALSKGATELDFARKRNKNGWQCNFVGIPKSYNPSVVQFFHLSW